MGFLHPGLALAGVLLIGLPILIHLLNRRRFKIVDWAAMDLLRQAMKRNRRKLRFESWLLLLLRCLVIGLLGVAIARPLGCSNSAVARLAGQDGGLHIFVLDDSGSTAHASGDMSSFDRIQQLATARLAALASGGAQVAVLSASASESPSQRDPIAAPVFDVAAASSAVAAMEPTQLGTDLAGALARAAEMTTGLQATVYVITDSAAAAIQDERLASAAEAISRDATLLWHTVPAEGDGNAAVLQLSARDTLLRRGFDTPISAQVARFGTASDAQASWQIDGQPIETVPASLSPDPSRLAAPLVDDYLADGGSHVLSLSVAGADGLPADDTRRLAIRQIAELPVLIVEGSRGSGALDSSGDFLAAALDPGSNTGFVGASRMSDLQLPGTVLSDYRAVMLAGISVPDEATAAAMADYVAGGGTLVWWLGEATDPDTFNEVLAERGLLPGAVATRQSTPPGQDAFAFDFDPQQVHPYLEAFRNIETTGLGSSSMRQYWQLQLAEDAGADVVLGVAGTGDPAVVVHRLGGGRVLTIATAAGDAAWTLLPLKRNFPALVNELLRHAVGDADAAGTRWQNLVVGQRLRVPATIPMSPEARLLDEAGDATPLERTVTPTGRAAWRSMPLVAAGQYTLVAGEQRLPVIVNFPAAESDVRPASEAAVRAALGDADVTFLGEEMPSVGAAGENQPDFGWSILLVVLLLAAGEAVLATRLSRG